jgi:hypothetical protein
VAAYDAAMSMPPPPPPPSDGVPYGGPYGVHGGYIGYEHPEGTTVLVLGVLSLVVCQFLGPVAWIMGNNVIKEIDANPGAYTNRGSVQAGRICGIISSCLIIATVVIIAVTLLAVGAASA